MHSDRKPLTTRKPLAHVSQRNDTTSHHTTHITHPRTGSLAVDTANTCPSVNPTCAGDVGNAHDGLDWSRWRNRRRTAKHILGRGKLHGATTVSGQVVVPTQIPLLLPFPLTVPHTPYIYPHNPPIETVYNPPPQVHTTEQFPVISTVHSNTPTRETHHANEQVEEENSVLATHLEGTSTPPPNTRNVPPPNTIITDVYSLGPTGKPITSQTSVPFQAVPSLEGPQGECVRILAIVDSGAMINALDTITYERVSHRLNKLSPSVRVLRMADGSVVPSTGTWSGLLQWGRLQTTTTFEVFPSGGSWRMLIGKPLLEDFNSVHNYATDSITLTQGNITDTIHNFKHHLNTTNALPAYAIYPIINENPPLDNTIDSDNISLDDTFLVDNRDTSNENKSGDVLATSILSNNDNVFTRLTDKGPYHPPRVAKILDTVTIGPLEECEKAKVRNLISEFADVFALSVREVKQVDLPTFRLNMPKDVEYPTKVNQRPLTQAQKEWYMPVLNDLTAAGVLREIRPDEVKAAHPTVLAQKVHGSPGLSMDEIKWLVEDECIRLGQAPNDNMPPRPIPHAHDRDSTTPSKPKWRITQNFNSINKACSVAPMVQGDIRAKQQRMAGHKYVCVIDFASGFYAIKVEEEDQPYLCIYTEGRGYHCYCRMPMGIMGAPSCFAELTAQAFQDIMLELGLETFVDDNGMAGDDFDDLLERLKRFFERCRARGLSVSPSKTQLFMQEVVYGGARVGSEGIKPDIAKLEAITKWPTPANLHTLMKFLGLTGYFRSLIKDYARIAAPLTDLQRNLDLPQPAAKLGKRKYKQFLRDRNLDAYWTPKHTKAFTQLKKVLTSEPVLRAPKFDGTPFILTTDGCKDGFGAVLSQRHTSVLSNGETITRIHPIGYASKRSSPVEEWYKPYVLEFAALKFGMDHFSDITWDFPIEVETDCIALRDTMCSENPSLAHARWRDGISTHYLTDVRHRPGRSNEAADALSRKFTGLPYEEGDGSAWNVSEDWEAASGLINDMFTIQSDSSISSLRVRFTNEPLLLEVIEAIHNLDGDKPDRVKQRARHRACNYLIDDGRLWRIAKGRSVRARARTECILQEEAIEMAKREHTKNGHWGRDLIKTKMIDSVWSPKLDQSIQTAILQCPQCKLFGPSHLHALMDPITRRHPFELVVADYLSLPKGRGGFHSILLLVDVFSQYVWGFKFRHHGTAKTTLAGLDHLEHMFRAPEALMTDGGSHFDNREVKAWCEARGTTHHITAAYSPWINGLVESTNGRLLGRLRRLCNPAPNEYSDNATRPDDIARAWQDHFDDAIQHLNERIIPAFNFSPKELLLGIVVNTPLTSLAIATEEPQSKDINLHLAYVAQQRLDAADLTVAHAIKRKAIFDNKVLLSQKGPVSFKKGHLVQVYDSTWDNTMSTLWKILPKWSVPRKIVDRVQNSYRLETLEGVPISGLFHARRLRRFIPQRDSLLEELENKELNEESEDSEERE